MPDWREGTEPTAADWGQHWPWRTTGWTNHRFSQIATLRTTSFKSTNTTSMSWNNTGTILGTTPFFKASLLWQHWYFSLPVSEVYSVENKRSTSSEETETLQQNQPVTSERTAHSELIQTLVDVSHGSTSRVGKGRKWPMILRKHSAS